MAIPITFDLESPSWLRNMRWAAIAGMALSVLGARFLGVVFPCYGIGVLLSGLALWNLFLPWTEQNLFSDSKFFVFTQIVVDILVLTGVLWYSGGLANPFVGFLILHVLIAGLLLTPLYTALISAFASLSVLSLIGAPGLLVNGQILELRSSPIWFGLPIGLILVIFFTNGFILIFLNRLGLAQDQLRQRVKMDALGRLVAGLAHEIGTPLNSILVLSKDLESSVPAEHQKELSIITSQAKRCGEIVSLLLGYSRTLVRRSEDMAYVSVPLSSWLREIYSLLVETGSGAHPLAPDKVEFDVKIEGLSEELEVPELILRQVMENLFKNARDAVSNVHNPKILVSAYWDSEEDEINICVEDNGPGFSKEVRERAFEAFFTTKKMGSGTGMGLYISYYLLSQVSGRIVIEQSEGEGGRVRVAFPRTQERTLSL